MPANPNPSDGPSILPFDVMLQQLVASVKDGRNRSPAFTLLLGSGFSWPVIPLPSEMVRDIAWWLLRPDRDKPFTQRPHDPGPDVLAREKELWREIKRNCAELQLEADTGLADMRTADGVIAAYQAIMSPDSPGGLYTPELRRRYLQDVVKRAGNRINGAHLHLAGILHAQGTFPCPFSRTIFTTNFDPLLQRGLQLFNELYFMSDRPDVLEPPADDEVDAIHLIYTHGTVHRYILNTREELERARQRNWAQLVPYFESHGVVVIGYSGWNDTTMQALEAARRFNRNLYWCDVHSANELRDRLRSEVFRFLVDKRGNAFYVSVPGADAFMQRLHAALGLGAVPDLFVHPIDSVIAELDSVDLAGVITSGPQTSGKPADAAPGGETIGTAGHALESLDEYRKRTVKALKGARMYLEEGSGRIAARSLDLLINRAGQEFLAGQTDVAVEMLTIVIDHPAATGGQKAQGRVNRGMAYGLKGETDKEIADYTAVIDDPAAPADQKANARFNRGVTYAAKGDTDKAIADYTPVIEDPGAPADGKAKARVNRGVGYGAKGETAKEMADYAAVIDDPAAPADPKAKARFNRGVAYGAKGETDNEIADYTALIDDPAAPADAKAKARVNRGAAFGVKGETDKAIADCTAVIGDPAAPGEQKAQARFNRGVAYGAKGETDNEIADYTAVIDDPAAPADAKAKARLNRGPAFGVKGETDKAIADCTAVIGDPAAPAEQKAKARFNRGVAYRTRGETDNAIADYTGVIEDPSALSAQRALAGGIAGWLEYSRGNIDGLIQRSQQALERQGDLRWVRFNLAFGLLLKGLHQEAMAQYATGAQGCTSRKELEDAIRDLRDAKIPAGSVKVAQQAIEMLQKQAKVAKG